jgi:hypothetical protein
MASLDSRVELLGLAAVRVKFLRAPATVQAEAVQVIQQQATPMVAAMQTATFTRIQKHAARSLDLRRDRFGVELVGAARGTPLDRALYYGGEYGGRKSQKVRYATRSRAGRAYVVRRRTTMQFLPHLGREGYFLWPTVREWLPTINKAIGQQLVKVLS